MGWRLQKATASETRLTFSLSHASMSTLFLHPTVWLHRILGSEKKNGEVEVELMGVVGEDRSVSGEQLVTPPTLPVT